MFKEYYFQHSQLNYARRVAADNDQRVFFIFTAENSVEILIQNTFFKIIFVNIDQYQHVLYLHV